MKKNTEENKNEVVSVSASKLNNTHHKKIEDLINKILNTENKEASISKEELDSILITPTFSEMIVVFMNRKHLKNVDVYKSAKLDRRLFSKIISNRNYQPSKETAIHLCMALRLSIEESIKLLSAAGFAFSHSKLSNIVVEHFLINKKHNLDSLYEVLDSLGVYEDF